MNQYKLEHNDFKNILNILENSKISNVVKGLENVYLILKGYAIDNKTYEYALQEVIDNLNEYEDWWNYFDETELLEEIVVFRVKTDPYDFVELFHKYTDKSTSEIRELIDQHCDVFEEAPEGYYKFL